MLHGLRCRVGIALKLAGCALIHGWGHHLWGEPVEWPGGRGPSVAACRSCGKYRTLGEPEVEGRALKAWRHVEAGWVAATDPVVGWTGRLGCRVLDQHHYLACRGRADHGARLVDGYPAPARR